MTAPIAKGRSVIQRFTQHLRSNVVGYLALFVALGGTSYAATALPRNSVGTAQLRRHSVTQSKLGAGLGGEVFAVTEINQDGGVVLSSSKVTVSGWNTGQPTQVNTSGLVTYAAKMPKDCVPVATPIGENPVGSLNLPSVSAIRAGDHDVYLLLNAPVRVSLAIVCGR